MKTLLTLFAVFTISVSFSQNYSESFTASYATDFEDVNDFTESKADVSEYEFSFNADLGDVTFNAPEKIDIVNVYNAENQEIFSAAKDIITEGKINLSYLPSGTYYLEIVVGENKGSQMLAIR